MELFRNRLLAAVLVGLFAFALSACADDEEAENDTEDAVEDVEDAADVDAIDE